MASFCLVLAVPALRSAMYGHASAPSPGRALDTPRLLVVNQGDATVSVVDPEAAKAVATIHESIPGMVGHEIAVSADGRFGYLPLYGDSGLGRPGSDGDSLLVLDLASAQVVRRVSFDRGLRPHCAVLDPAAQLLYVTTELAQSVSIIDTKTMSITGSIPTGAEQSHMLVLSHDGRFGYTANVSTGTVSVLDLPTRKLLTKVSVAPTIQRISISPDDRTVVTADQSSPRLAFVDTKTHSVRSWMQLPSLGYGSVFTRDGKRLLITLPQTGQLAAIDVATQKIDHIVDVGARPQEVLIRPDGRFAYVSCFGARHVSVVDLSTWQVVNRIDTGEKADGMVWVQ